MRIAATDGNLSKFLAEWLSFTQWLITPGLNLGQGSTILSLLAYSQGVESFPSRGCAFTPITASSSQRRHHHRQQSTGHPTVFVVATSTRRASVARLLENLQLTSSSNQSRRHHCRHGTGHPTALVVATSTCIASVTGLLENSQSTSSSIERHRHRSIFRGNVSLLYILSYCLSYIV